MIMTDLHTHILPDIDAGAPDIETSRRMLEAMYKSGVRTAVCTPHFSYTNTSPEDFLNKRAVRAAELKNVAESIGVKVLLGCELKLSSRVLHIDSIKEFCIGNTRYILIEMPFDKKWEESSFDVLANLSDYYNVTPVIAHVERYHPVIKSIKIAEKLIELGAVLQLDASSLFEKDYSKTAKKLLKNDMITVVASDAHNTDTRPPEVLVKAYNEIERLCGRQTVLEFIENADLICKA